MLQIKQGQGQYMSQEDKINNEVRERALEATTKNGETKSQPRGEIRS